MEAEQPIIVIKKKGGHAGHHGGAWKVAYADFVTAMMSLFIVLWLMNSTPKPVQEAIAGYFNDPKGTASKKGSTGTEKAKEDKPVEKKTNMAALKLDLDKAIEKMNLLNSVKKQIEITVTEEGLRIELVEDEKGTFFEVGKAKPTPMLGDILKVLAAQLKDLPNKISIEGYTDAQPYANNDGYGNWELSSDRANEARREMQHDGIRPNQVSQVRGFADQRLHVPDKPFDAANRRISLVVQNLAPAAGITKVSPPAKPEPASQSAEHGAAPNTPKSEGAAAAVTPASTAAKPQPSLMERAKSIFSHQK
jgi:chemotaxis protein MotB